MSFDTELRRMLHRVGMDYFQKYYGMYSGTIANVKDPNKAGRVQVKVPALYGKETHDYWALPKGIPNEANGGQFWIPPVGTAIWVSFENGNVRFPVWEYGHWGTTKEQGNSPLAGIYDDDGMPTKRQWTTAAGQTLLFDDKNKTVSLIDANGHKVVMSQSDLTLIATDLIAMGAADASHPAVLGDKNKDVLNAILDGLAAATVTVSGGAVPLNNAATFTLIKSTQVEPTLSTLVKLKK